MLLRAARPGIPQRRGVVLIAVLVVVVLLTLAAYQYSELMLAQYKASSSFSRAAQARAAAESGANYAAMLLSDPNAFANTLGNNPHDNPTVFQNIPVSNSSGTNQVYFSVIAPQSVDDLSSGATQIRYGAIDESGKINVNSLLKFDSSGTLGAQVLQALGIPSDTANSILDWVDSKSTTPRPGGAKDETYSPMGYLCKNGPADTLEELLYVKGVTADLLFGTDLNRNGIIDPEEMNAGTPNLGWQAFLTVYSREQNVDGTGAPRLYINSSSTLTLYSKLVDAIGQDMANYLLLYRRAGPATSPMDPNMRTQTVPASQIQRTDLGLSLYNPNARTLASIYELIGTKVMIPSQDPRQPSKMVECPLNDKSQARTLLPTMLDKLTTSADQDMPARINVNTAPLAVLTALPGVASTDVSTIQSARPNPTSGSASDPIYQTTAWLYTEAGLSPDVLKTLDRFVTARTQVYRIQVVGQFSGNGPSARIEAVIDTNRGRPRFVYWRDLSELGRGFNMTSP
jgi:type II secretory pathway component PulK